MRAIASLVMADVWVLTGGIGSGKSTIRQALDRLGAVTIDADRVGHVVLEPTGSAFDAVARRWPSVVFDGRIDRAALGAIVFSDPDELRSLEAITHPAIAAGIARRIAEAGAAVVVIEVSVPKDLVGVGWMHTIVADLDEEERIRRLVARGMDEADVRRRMGHQPSRDGWRARGRWIISTAGTREEVEEDVRRLWNEVISR
jgi:dephospho-CoA kinase